MSLVVIKVGGDIARSPNLGAVAGDVGKLARRGDRVIVVHGGGPQATEMQHQLGQEPNIVGGRRITDDAALDVMKMVVGGRINIDLCAALLAAGARPVGLHGASSLAVAAVKRPPRVVSGGGDEPIDFGNVGDVTGVNRELISLLVGTGHVPVIACLGADESGTIYNINADIVANQVAKHLAAHHLVLVTNTAGVLRDVGDPSSRIKRLTSVEAADAIRDGTVAGGMIPKLEESMQVLAEGSLEAIHIVGNLASGELLRALDSPGSVGTALVR